MRTLSLALAASLALTAAACRPESSGPRDGPGPSRFAGGLVEASRVDGGIQVSNGTHRPVAYAVWAHGFLGLLAPCVDPGPECVRLAPGASAVVPVGEITGMWPGEREAAVYWWHVIPDGAGGYRAEEVYQIIVPL